MRIRLFRKKLLLYYPMWKMVLNHKKVTDVKLIKWKSRAKWSNNQAKDGLLPIRHASKCFIYFDVCHQLSVMSYFKIKVMTLPKISPLYQSFNQHRTNMANCCFYFFFHPHVCAQMPLTKHNSWCHRLSNQWELSSSNTSCWSFWCSVSMRFGGFSSELRFPNRLIFFLNSLIKFLYLKSPFL